VLLLLTKNLNKKIFLSFSRAVAEEQLDSNPQFWNHYSYIIPLCQSHLSNYKLNFFVNFSSCGISSTWTETLNLGIFSQEFYHCASSADQIFE